MVRAERNKARGNHSSTGGHDAVAVVDGILSTAARAGASDIHFEPAAGAMVVRFRLDGVLNDIESLSQPLGQSVVTRLKVLAGLLTYRKDIPQEGRLKLSDQRDDTGVLDRRLAIFPTIHGQRAVVRLFYDDRGLGELDRLGFGGTILTALKQIAADDMKAAKAAGTVRLEGKNYVVRDGDIIKFRFNV